VPAAVTPADTVPADTVPGGDTSPSATASPDAFSDGWFSDPSAIPQAFLWGLALTAVGVGVYLLSRKARRYWVGILAGFIPFIVVLYFFYENVNRLLPPNL
jgi:sortase A